MAFGNESFVRQSLESGLAEWHKALAESGLDVPFDEHEVDACAAAGGAALQAGASLQDALEIALLGYYESMARKHPALAPSLEPVVAQLSRKHRHVPADGGGE